MKRRFHILYKTSNGFIRYLTAQRNSIISKFQSFNDRKKTYEYQLEEYMELRELVLLDNEFFSLLDFGEHIAVDDTIRGVDLSEFGEKLLNKAQRKWIKTFFKEESIYKELDPIAIGIVLKKIREVKGYSKTKMAQDIRFHRTYIARVEKGEILPSLEFVYRFCKICEISIDRILNLIE